MNLTYDFLITEIDKKIKTIFPLISYNVYEDIETGDMTVAFHSEEIYYSDKCMNLITEINMDILWPKNIYNFIFIYEDSTIYKTEYRFSISNMSSCDNYTLNSSTYKHSELIYLCSDDDKMVA